MPEQEAVGHPPPRGEPVAQVGEGGLRGGAVDLVLHGDVGSAVAAVALRQDRGPRGAQAVVQRPESRHVEVDRGALAEIEDPVGGEGQGGGVGSDGGEDAVERRGVVGKLLEQGEMGGQEVAL